MATTVQHVAGEMSSTPVIGAPWNFSKRLDGLFMPWVIASDKNLPPVARILWGVIRQYSFRNSPCLATDKTLARALGVSERQFRRHAAARLAAPVAG